MLAMLALEISAPQAEALNTAEAFRSFYERALPRVYAYFLHRCGAASVAEDLTQETFLAAVREIRRKGSIESPTPWVLAIARHKLIDHYRAREREERRLEAVQSAVQGDELIEWRGEESRERALTALQAVAPSQRAALVLRYLDGLSVPEVAKAVGKSVHATESLIARGKQSFRRAYLEEQHA